MASASLSNDQKDQRTKDYHLVTRNSIILFGRYMVLWALNAALALFLPRYLGAEGLGQLQFALSFASLCSIGVGLGVRQYLVKEIARSPRELSGYFASAAALRMMTTVVVLAGIVASIQFMGMEGAAETVLYLAAGWMVVTSFARLIATTLQGIEDMAFPAFAEMVNKAVVVVAGITVLLMGMGVVAFAAVTVAGAAVNLGMNAVYLRRRAKVVFSVEWSRIYRIFTGSMPFLLMGVLLQVYNHIDVIMLRFFTTETVVGWHAAALNIYRSLEFLPIVLTMALLPALSRLFNQDRASLLSMARRALSATFLTVVPISVAMGVLAWEIIGFLPFPDTFSNSAPVLALMAVTILLTSLLTLFGTIAAAVDRQRAWSMVLLATVVFNVTFNIIAIPYTQDAIGNGAVGAAAATAVSEASMLLVGWWLLPRELFNWGLALTFAKVSVAAGGMALVLVTLTSLGLPLIATALAGALAYGLLALVIRAVSLDELRFLWQAARSKDASRDTADKGDF